MVSPDGRSSIVGFYLNSIDKKGEGGEWGRGGQFHSFVRPGFWRFARPRETRLCRSHRVAS